MYRILFVFLCLLSVATSFVFQQKTCSNTTYSMAGQPCDSNSQLCKIFTVCNQTEGFCRPGHIGDSCAKSSDCFLSSLTDEGVRCVKGKCTMPTYNGFACSVNEECFGNICVNGKCSGKGNGDLCDPTAAVQCDNGFFCSFAVKRCLPQLNFNETCWQHLENPEIDPRIVPEGSNFNVVCKGGMMCMGDRGAKKCAWYRGGSVGDSCNFQRDRNFGCNFGLQCHPQTGKCYVHGGSTTKCPGEARDCLSNERCVCQGNNGNGKCIYVAGSNEECGFADTSKRWLECSKTHNCPLDSKTYFNRWLVEAFSSETCMGKNCGNIPRAFLCCTLKFQEKNEYSPNQIGQISQFCVESSPLWIIFVILLVMIGFVTVICLFAGIFLAFANRSGEGWQEI